MSRIKQLWRSFTEPRVRRRAPIEIAYSIVNDVSGRVQPLGIDKNLFPFSAISVRLFPLDEDECATFNAMIAGDQWELRDRIISQLEEQGCQVPLGFRLEVEVAEADEQRSDAPVFEISYRATVGGKSSTIPLLEVTIVIGKATQPIYRLNQSRVYLGRLEEVLDSKLGVRRNDISFLEEDGPNRYVGRRHAEIRWDEDSRTYRIRDEYSRHGTHIARDNRSIRVTQADRRGVVLQPGDLVYLGKACVQVDFSSDLLTA